MSEVQKSKVVDALRKMLLKDGNVTIYDAMSGMSYEFQDPKCPARLASMYVVSQLEKLVVEEEGTVAGAVEGAGKEGVDSSAAADNPMYVDNSTIDEVSETNSTSVSK